MEVKKLSSPMPSLDMPFILDMKKLEGFPPPPSKKIVYMYNSQNSSPGANTYHND